MKRNVLVVANWKNNTTLSDAHVLAMGVRNEIEHLDGVKVVLCPPAVWVTEVRNIVHDQIHHMGVGLQDISAEQPGPTTGEIAADLVESLIDYAIIGHSETLKLHNYDVETISEKIHSALASKITPIICVGEKSQSSSSRHSLARKLDSYLKGVSAEKRSKCIIAYEPIWAISGGSKKSRRAASAEYVNDVAVQLKKVVPANTRVLYGGSVSAENILQFIAQPEIDGVLVGGASLHLREFTTLVKNAARGS